MGEKYKNKPVNVVSFGPELTHDIFRFKHKNILNAVKDACWVDCATVDGCNNIIYI